MTRHDGRTTSAAARVALAALLLTACVGRVRLAPGDPSWSAASAPITWTSVVTTPSGESTCPFRFVVESSAHETAPAVKFVVGAILIVPALALLVVFEHPGGP